MKKNEVSSLSVPLRNMESKTNLLENLDELISGLENSKSDRF